MDAALIVQIFVQGDNPKHGRVATGYPATRELVLTARHALTPEGKPDEAILADRVEMRWRNLGENKDKIPDWSKVNKEDIVWDDKKLDLALVRFPLPNEKTLQVTLSDQMPPPRSEWHTVSFPNFGVRDAHKSDPWSLTGTTLPAAKTDGCFELLADLDPNKPEQWGGASGAPVLVGTQIVGVIVEARPRGKVDGLQHDQLIAISLQHVFKTNEEFCNNVRPNDPDGSYCKELAHKIALYLAENKSIRQDLNEKLQLNVNGSDDDKNNAIAQHLLLSQPFEPIKASLETLYTELEKQNEVGGTGPEGKSLVALSDIYVIVMTYRYHPDGVNKLALQQQASPGDPLRVEAITYAAIELIMAYRDNGTASLVVQEISEPDKDGNMKTTHDIRSDFQLPMPPEVGRDPKEWLRAFLMDLHALFDSAPEHRQIMSSRALASEVHDDLSDLRKEDGRTRYIVFMPSYDDDPERHKERADLASLIKDNFPKSKCPVVEAILVKSELDNDYEQCRKKERELKFLRELLKKRIGKKIP